MKTWRFVLLTTLGLAACGKGHGPSLKDDLGTIIDRGGGGGGGPKDPGPPPPTGDYPAFKLALTPYADCQAVQDDVRTRLTDWRAQVRKYRQWQAQQNAQSQSGGVVMASASAGKSGATTVTNGAMAPAPAASGAPAADSASQTFTNVQEQGVDEADRFKVGPKHVFTVHQGRLEVVARASLTYLGSLDLAGLRDVTLYAEGDRLLAVGTRVVPASEPGLHPLTNGSAVMTAVSPGGAVSGPATGGDGGTASGSAGGTEVRVFDAAGDGLPVPLLTKQFLGSLTDSRYTAGRLVLVMTDQLAIDDPVFPNEWGTDDAAIAAAPAAAPVRLEGGASVRDVPCGRLLRQQLPDFDFRLTEVVTMDAEKIDAPLETTALLGGGDQIYMSESALYVAKAGVRWYGWDGWSSDAPRRPEQLVVTRVAFDRTTGAVTPQAAGAVEGRIKDQFSFKELAADGTLAIATSTGQLQAEGEDAAANHLSVLKPDAAGGTYPVVGDVPAFGAGEDIRSVRFVGNTAYVVTFKKTDPLFAFDLSDPVHPKALGELQVPGFSVYMQPVSDHLLVGVGFDADDQGEYAWYQGLQVSLFDVTDPLHPQRLDNHVIGARGSYSDVTSDHHAFFFDPETKTIGVPLVQLGRPDGSVGGPELGSRLDFSGAVLYSVGDKLTETARVSHADLMPPACAAQLAQGQWWQNDSQSLDVERLFEVDGKLLSLSRFGIKAHDPKNPGQVSTILKYAANDADCPVASPLVY